MKKHLLHLTAVLLCIFFALPAIAQDGTIKGTFKKETKKSSTVVRINTAEKVFEPQGGSYETENGNTVEYTKCYGTIEIETASGHIYGYDIVEAFPSGDGPIITLVNTQFGGEYTAYPVLLDANTLVIYGLEEFENVKLIREGAKVASKKATAKKLATKKRR